MLVAALRRPRRHRRHRARRGKRRLYQRRRWWHGSRPSSANRQTPSASIAVRPRPIGRASLSGFCCASVAAGSTGKWARTSPGYAALRWTHGRSANCGSSSVAAMPASPSSSQQTGSMACRRCSDTRPPQRSGTGRHGSRTGCSTRRCRLRRRECSQALAPVATVAAARPLQRRTCWIWRALRRRLLEQATRARSTFWISARPPHRGHNLPAVAAASMPTCSV
mmetsp:Transcript_1870/g.5590  ORF Transcript_1870/g.5590 Transcript_1870/m.5590 type:complete len:223 (-) Transcript_1870:567-1235(-)